MNEKFEGSNVSEDKKIGRSPGKSVKGSEEIFLMFRENRAYELRLGRNVFRFEGREKKKFPVSVLKHKDFTDRIQKKFVVEAIN